MKTLNQCKMERCDIPKNLCDDVSKPNRGCWTNNINGNNCEYKKCAGGANDQVKSSFDLFQHRTWIGSGTAGQATQNS